MGCRDVSGISQGGGGFSLPNTIVIDTSGTYTSSANVQYIEVYAIGGGGGGGGGSTSGNGSGTGGGASCPSVLITSAGTYAVTIGTGGAGGIGGGSNGSSGTATTFGAGLLISNPGSGGDFGVNGTVSTALLGGHGGSAHATAMYSFGRESGSPSYLNQGGNGGSNYFGTGGRGAYRSSGAVTGESGTGYGAGGAGGTNVGAIGGAGSNGAVIIIEYF